ncbi:ATP-binding cassette domain-containing protein [Paracoccus suum]|uniref:UvrABC system protein A n=1 Tax=Paracoccus suum TaxID=2259340 RepID=A0A344PIL9_9RHOB|nr:ATP-binding cassette domain-containing protein [Paracoccus suum]AXC49224.1 ATP-binding cassette domain-containing protein [Paracoccus suum]
MDTAEVPCRSCGGSGYSDAALAVKIAGRTIADIATLPVVEALKAFSDDSAIAAPLERMRDVGLAYMRLGQQLNSLSGGERQRLRLADELGRESSTYLLDEPTSGLHMADVDHLLGLFDQLIESGKSLIVVEHNLQVISKADWIVEMGPGPGKRGGRVIFKGSPKEMLRSKQSITGPFLKGYLEGQDWRRSRQWQASGPTVRSTDG